MPVLVAVPDNTKKKRKEIGNHAGPGPANGTLKACMIMITGGGGYGGHISHRSLKCVLTAGSFRKLAAGC